MREAVKAGTTLIFLPPYSPYFNPIKNAFSKLTSLLRKAAARTVADLWRVIGDCMDAFTPAECQNRFSYCGYDAFLSKVALEAVMDLEAGLIHSVSDEHLPQAVPV